MECHRGSDCPYLNGGDVWRLIGERDYLSQWIDEMERVMALAETEIEKLRQENQNLKEESQTLRYELKQVLGKIFKPRIKPNLEPTGRSRVSTSLGEASSLDSPRVKGIIYNQAEADQKTNCHLTVLF